MRVARILSTAVAAVAALTTAATAQTTITFDDGTNGAAIGSFYSGLGVTFSNAQFDNFASTNEGTVSAGGLKFISISATYQPKVGTSIVAVFATPLTSASVRALNVGANGARVDAYNAVTGGTLVAFDQAAGVADGSANHPLLSVAGVGIRRLEFYQPLNVTTEGVLFDNLTFTPAAVSSVPEPATVSLVAGGALLLAAARRRRRA